MAPTSLIPSGELVLLDSVALIYFLGTHPAYGTLAKEVATRVVTGDLAGVISTVAIPEVLAFEYRNSARHAQALRGQLLTMPNVDWIAVSVPLADHAARLRARYNLTTADAIHVATGLDAGADWMVTNDRRLRRVEAEGIRVWLFDEHLAAAPAASGSTDL